MEDIEDVEVLTPSGEGPIGFGLYGYGMRGRGLYLFGEGRAKHFSRFTGVHVPKYQRHRMFSRGSGITPYGMGITPYGMGIVPYGGLSLKGISKDLKKAVAPVAKEVVKQFKSSDTGKEILRSKEGRAAVDIGQSVLGSRPVRAKTKGIRSILGGNFNNDGNSQYELNQGQLDYLNQLKKKDPNAEPPALDRHQLLLMNNIIQGKQILGESRKEAPKSTRQVQGSGMRYMRK